MVKPQPQTCYSRDQSLDALQIVLDLIGFLPGLGDICDGINAVISYLRENYVDALISVGCIVFSMVADVILKPIKWAAKSVIEAATAIVKKIPDFASKVCKFLKSVPSKLPTWLFDNKTVRSVKKECYAFADYITKLFQNLKVWEIKPIPRGKEIEKVLAKTKYLFHEHVGKLAGGYFPAFDFIKGKKSISVKSLNMGVGKYTDPDKAIKQINKYVDDLINSKTKISNLKRGKNDKTVQKWLKRAADVTEKQLDIYVPKGTSHLIDKKKIKSGKKIVINIIEYGR